MKISLSRTIAGLPVAIIGLVMASHVSAGVVVTLSETGFAPLSFSAATNPGSAQTPPSGVAYGTFSNVQVTASSFASSADDAKLETTAMALRNDAASTDTLSITVTADPYSVPGGSPLKLESSLSDSMLSGAGQGLPGNAAGVIDLVSSLASPPFGASTSSPHLSLSGLANPNQAQSVTAPFTLAANSGVYQLESSLAITLGANQSTTLAAATDAVPEPSTVVLFATALLLLGVAKPLRRLAGEKGMS